MKERPAGLFGGMNIELGKVGIWRHPSGLTPEVVAEVEALGYGAIWVGGSPPGDLGVVEHLLDGAANVACAVQQSAVDIEQVDGKRRNHYAGCEPSLRPGTRRPLSGRSTCCVWSAESFGPLAGLERVEALEASGRLAGYHLLPATRADFLRRLGRLPEASVAYAEALELTSTDAERRYLGRRLAETSI